MKGLNLADQILTDNFEKKGPVVSKLSDPLVDTPMVVTLDQLKPYEHNPRITRNPLYDEIKSSIRERGLDAPPAITRRPGESHFIIRNGGNTRLSILKELWSETREERFFRIHCLFRPWVNEIVALTGHLAENELHGELTFIERALGVQKIKDIYEKELGTVISQSALSKRLKTDGYPVSQTMISYMHLAVSTLLPAIPTLLYGGLSLNKVSKILAFRKTANETWEKYLNISDEMLVQTFDQVFYETLSMYNDSSNDFDFTKFQDELISYLAQVFKTTYEKIGLDLREKESIQRFVELPPSPPLEINEAELFSKTQIQQVYGLNSLTEADILSIRIPKPRSEPPIRITRTDAVAPTQTKAQETGHQEPHAFDDDGLSEEEAQQSVEQYIEEHIISPVDTTPRLSAIQGMVAGITGDTEPNFRTNVVKSIPVQAGGLYAISDIWHISANLDNPDSLRMHIGQLVLEIAEESETGLTVHTIDSGLGFTCSSMQATDWTGQILNQFLHALTGQQPIGLPDSETLLPALFGLLTGGRKSAIKRLNDVAFVKLLRVFRLARRYFELSEMAPENR